jgi:hypothetical protein
MTPCARYSTPTRSRIACGRAVLLALLLSPTVARLLPLVTGGTSWVEVCTGAGMRWVPQSQAPADGSSDALGAAPACKWCSHAAAAVAAPPPADPSPWRLTPCVVPTMLVRAAPAHSPLVWARAAPRGPPTIS